MNIDSAAVECWIREGRRKGVGEMKRWSYLVLFVCPLAAAAEPGLLKAISFALTGSDASTFEFSDSSQCIVHRMVSSAHGHGEETYYLNRVDPARTAFTQYTQKYPEYAMSQSFSTVELHGEGTVYEYHWITDRPAFDDTFRTADHEITVYTSEHSRLLRAWKYLYSHGCQAAHSSY
jgi:hypothetical protein